MSTAIIGGIVKKQIAPIKEDLTYIKTRIDEANDRLTRLTERLESIEEIIKKEKEEKARST